MDKTIFLWICFSPYREFIHSRTFPAIFHCLLLLKSSYFKCLILLLFSASILGCRSSFSFIWAQRDKGMKSLNSCPHRNSKFFVHYLQAQLKTSLSSRLSFLVASQHFIYSLPGHCQLSFNLYPQALLELIISYLPFFLHLRCYTLPHFPAYHFS